MRILTVPVNGPQSIGVHFCPTHEARKCRFGPFGLGCEYMHRVLESARVRCQHDAQGRECPRLQVCTLNHLHPVNTQQLAWVYTIVEDRSSAWIGPGVEIGEGGDFRTDSSQGASSVAAVIRRGEFQGRS